jgi:peptidoglycan-N-acetylglucosamine deacetylase
MGLSRSRKLVLLGTALIMIGLTGRASANTTTPSVTPQAAPSAPSAAPATAPAAPRKPTSKKQTKPGTRKAAVTGPAGSRATTGGKTVALTFDDGPDPATTPQILKLLAQHRVHATFCLVGVNARRHPALVRQIVAGGHTLCNHTWHHNLKLGKQSAAKIKADLEHTNAAIRAAVPQAKIRYFRAPGGKFTPGVVATARQLGMSSIYWKVDPRDWHHPKGETSAQHRSRVIRMVEKHTHKGAIVLSHDFAQPDTVAAYRTLLPWLRKRFTLVALPV